MAKVLPAPAIDKTKLSVLPMLQKRDPHIIRSVESSGHVALYDFDDVKQSWARTNVEGSLHLVERDIDPRYQLIIINKMNPENKIEDVTPEFQIQNADPYMFYKNRRGETHGIWFYNAGDRERMCNFIDSLREEDMVVPPPATPTSIMTNPEPPLSSSPPSEGEENIMRFFSHLSTKNTAPSNNAATQVPPPAMHLPHHATHMPSFAGHGPSLLEMNLGTPANSAALPLPPPYPAGPAAGFPYMPAQMGTPPPFPTSSPVSASAPPAALTQMLAAAAAAKSKPTPPAAHSTPTKTAALSKQQLRDAIIKLAADDDFLDMVYNHYIAATQVRP